MAKVLGVGGIFFKSPDPKKLFEWYTKWLGMELTEWGIAYDPKELPANGQTVWNAFDATTDYFALSEKGFMFNLIVDDVEEAIKQVKEGGAEIVGEIQKADYGSFGWFIDPDGNKVELWEPGKIEEHTMNKQERNEKIELYGRGYELLKAVLAEVPAEAMKFKPAPSEWSVYEIIIHIADSESNAALRARKLIVEPGGVLMGYDQDAWANTLKYHEHSIDDALETTRLVRKTTYELLKRQPDEVFTHSVKHPEYDEPYTFEKWIDIYSQHIPGHVEQIKNNMKLWEDR